MFLLYALTSQSSISILIRRTTTSSSTIHHPSSIFRSKVLFSGLLACIVTAVGRHQPTVLAYPNLIGPSIRSGSRTRSFIHHSFSFECHTNAKLILNTSDQKPFDRNTAYSNSIVKMSASQSQMQLSREAMREKRLAALGMATTSSSNENNQDALQEQASKSKTKRSVEDFEHQDNATVKMAAAQKKPSEVIDLLWDDSSDDDEIMLSSNVKQRRPPPTKKSRVVHNKAQTDTSDSDEDLDENKNKNKNTVTNNGRGNQTSRNVKNPYAKQGKAATASSTTVDMGSKTAPKSDHNGSSSNSNSALRFQAATWNVWFGPNDSPNPHVIQRMRALTRLLRERADTRTHPLWFIGLQEVTDESFAPLLSGLQQTTVAHGQQQPFTTHIVRQGNSAPYYCVLAIRQQPGTLDVLDSGWYDYDNSIQGRGFCYARVNVVGRNTDGGDKDKQILVATTHLESWCGPQYTGVEQRKQQVLEWTEFCRKQMKRHRSIVTGIFMGDLNWDDESMSAKDERLSDQVLLGIPHHDAWTNYATNHGLKGPKAICYTYDAKLNPMLGGNLRRRFDRVLVFSRGQLSLQNITCTGTQLLGTDALPGLKFQKRNPFSGASKTYPTAPSDHFGFVAALEIE